MAGIHNAGIRSLARLGRRALHAKVRNRIADQPSHLAENVVLGVADLAAAVRNPKRGSGRAPGVEVDGRFGVWPSVVAHVAVRPAGGPGRRRSPVELPAPVEVAPVEVAPVELAAPVELPVELAPVLVVTEPPVEDVLEPFAPIEPEIAPRRQAAFKPTSNRQAMIRHFTLEDCAEAPNPSQTRQSLSYDFRAGTSSPRKATAWRSFGTSGAQGRNRTTDTRIFSPLLYRLSYLGGRSEGRDMPEGTRAGQAR